MNYTFKSVLALGSLSLLSACATVGHGPKQTIAIESDPPGAAVTVDSKPRGHTPLTLNLTRVVSHEVRVDRAGYKSETIKLRSRAWPDFQEEPSSALLVLVPINTISMVIDTLTTSAWVLDTQPTANVKRMGGQEKFSYGEFNGLHIHLKKLKPEAPNPYERCQVSV